MQPELELGPIGEAGSKAEYTARQALACFDGDPVRACRWIDKNLDYIQNQHDENMNLWRTELEAWIARGYAEAGFRGKPGYPQAKRKVLLDAKRIIENP